MNRIFEMRMNDWIARINVDDIETPPAARTLLFKSAIHRVNVKIEFKDRKMLNPEDKNISTEFGIPADEDVVFCFFTGDIPAPVPVKFNNSNIQVGGMIVGGSRMAGCGVGVQLIKLKPLKE